MATRKCGNIYFRKYFMAVRKLGPILCEIENADRKRKTAFFDLEFFDQKNKAILCARILAISVQHFSM